MLCEETNSLQGFLCVLIELFMLFQPPCFINSRIVFAKKLMTAKQNIIVFSNSYETSNLSSTPHNLPQQPLFSKSLSVFLSSVIHIVNPFALAKQTNPAAADGLLNSVSSVST